MGMHIDEARSDDLACSIDRVVRRLIYFPKPHNDAVLDPHVPPITDPSAAIDDRTAKNLKVDHSLLLFGNRTRPQGRRIAHPSLKWGVAQLRKLPCRSITCRYQ